MQLVARITALAALLIGAVAVLPAEAADEPQWWNRGNIPLYSTTAAGGETARDAGRQRPDLPGRQRQARLPGGGRLALRQGAADDRPLRAQSGLDRGAEGRRRTGRMGRLDRQARHRVRQHVRLRPRLPAALEGDQAAGPRPAEPADQLHLGGRHRQPGELLHRQQRVLRPAAAAGRKAVRLERADREVPRLRRLRRDVRLRPVGRVRRRQDLRRPRPDHPAVAGQPADRPAGADPAAARDAARQVRLPAGGRGRLPLRPVRRRHHRLRGLGAQPPDPQVAPEDRRLHGPDAHLRRLARPRLPGLRRRADAVRPVAQEADRHRVPRRCRAVGQGRTRRRQGDGPGDGPENPAPGDPGRHLGR